MELTDRSGYFAGPGMLGGSFGDASRASDEAAEGVADPCLGHAPDQVVFYELTRKFVETEEDVPQEACDVLYYTLAVGHHTGVLDCFEPRLSVPVDVFYSLVDALPEGEAKTKFEAIRSFGECQLDKAAVPSLLEVCDALLDERGFRGSAKAGISVFDDDFGLHAQQVAFLMKFRDLVERVRDVSGVYLTGGCSNGLRCGRTCERRPVCGHCAHGGKRVACRRCRRPRALQKDGGRAHCRLVHHRRWPNARG